MKDLFEDDFRRAQPDAGTRYATLVQLLASAGVPLGRTRLLDLARAAGLRAEGGRAYTAEWVAGEIKHATTMGQVIHTDLGLACPDAHRHAAFRAAALAGRVAEWRPLLMAALNVPDTLQEWSSPHSETEAIAVMRIAVCSGLTGKALEAVRTYLQRYDTTRLFFKGLCNPFDDALFECVAPALRDHYAERSLMWMLIMPNASAPHLVAWALRRSAAPGAALGLRYRVCEHLLWQSRFDEALACIKDEQDGYACALRGAAAVMQREPARAQALYVRAFELLRGDKRKTAGLLPLPNAWLYAAALIVAGEPAGLTLAQRLCRTEAREAGRYADWPWTYLQHAAAVRLGEADAAALAISMPNLPGLYGLIALECAAWIGVKADPGTLARAQRCMADFAAAGYRWAARECAAAIAIISGHTPGAEHTATLAAVFAREEKWRRALAAISALSAERRADAEDTRLAWVITMARDTLVEIEPWEQKRGPRGWNKGKRAAYARLTQSAALAPQDAPVCAAIERYSGNAYRVDASRALPALVGHPLVFFSDNLVTPVELVSSEPEMSVTRGKQGLRVALIPDLRPVFARSEFAIFAAQDSARNSERCLLLRDTPTRARVLRVNAAHKRIAELLGDALEVPEEGAAELARAIESAARHFQVHSAVASALPEIQADATLCAELAPAGDGLRLRLAVQPFASLGSAAGPRYAPGAGGARVIAEVAGERRAALRDLAAERAGADALLDALPLLEADGSTFEWHIDDAEDCLALVEALQGMVQNGEGVRIEWPAGVKYQVTRPYGVADFRLSCNASGDWFVASGGLQLDEGTVIDMARLIEFSRQSGGRFVPLGEGGFVALTEDLRRRIDEFASLGDVSQAGLRVHPLAAGALEQLAEGTNWSADPAWQTRLQKVREAETLEPAVPSTLSAELRAYQQDGYRWLARLAHWGAGACLADDMGLGKTVQTLALLLQRAAEGAALVVAPTSVCALWADEARRFAPTLDVQVLGAADRNKLVTQAGPYALVVCSYTLLQQEIDLFAARAWHTLVLDEAQAVKNFATKRAQAVFSLQAGFRIATTGTPVENRLDELWTLFRFLNPGLLGTRERFNERYAAPIERARDARARSRLRRLVRPFILRRTKSEVLTELPPRTEIVIQIEPDAAERAFYEALRRDALAAIEGAAGPLAQRRFQVLAQLTRLRRACCDPRLVAPERKRAGAKLEAFTEIVEELLANRHKALVFSQFTSYLALLRGELDRMGVPYQYLDGSTPAAERARAVAAFQKGEGAIFLISLRAGGFGLNLTAADYVIIADPWWNPAVEDQAAARAHRMGQERPVTVYRLVVKGSVEERIMAMHQDKRALAEGLFEGEEFGGAVSVDELVRLMKDAVD